MRARSFGNGPGRRPVPALCGDPSVRGGIVSVVPRTDAAERHGRFCGTSAGGGGAGTAAL